MSDFLPDVFDDECLCEDCLVVDPVDECHCDDCEWLTAPLTEEEIKAVEAAEQANAVVAQFPYEEK